MKCKIHKDIAPTTSTGEIILGCGNLEIATGGIMNNVILFNADEVENLEYVDDMRHDENLIVETIITSSNYFKVDGTSLAYEENFVLESNKFQHTLSLTLANIHPSLESTLYDAKNGRYIVCFRPKGQENYRMFGWKEGAQMEVKLLINESETNYKLVFGFEGIYPLFQVLSDNFNLKDKYYTPIWQPQYNINYCELNSGTRTGYSIASYVTKVNQAGQALDKNDQLCNITGLPQIAYKYIDVIGSGGYEIIGTYYDTAIFDGQPVKIYDETLCPPNAVGTITATPTPITLNSTTTSALVSVTTSNAWNLKQEPSYVILQPNNGTGNSSVNVKSNGVGGTDFLLFQNRVTKEIVQVLVNIYIIKTNTNINFSSGTKNFILTVNAEGGDRNFTYVTPSGLTIVKNGTQLICTVTSPSNDDKEFIIPVTHVNDVSETKDIKVTISGINTTPNWVTINTYCKTT